MVANQDGDVVRFPDKIIRTMGRNAMGLYAMKTTSNLVSLLSCDDDNLYTITISEKGFGKKTSLDQYRITGRYNKGISTMKCTKKTGKLVKLLLARKTDDVMITCKSGKSIRINVTDIKTISRDTQGVILVDIAENDSISDAVVIYNDTDGE
jgi:DNA gyrase subunit A